jgi:hypothetical protein
MTLHAPKINRMKKQIISRLAVGSLIVAFAALSMSCYTMYFVTDYYSYLPDGEITLSELGQYDAYSLKDTFGHPSDKYVPVYYVLNLQKKGTNKKTRYFYKKSSKALSGSPSPIKSMQHLSSVLSDSSHLFGIGDSIWLTLYYEHRDRYEKRIKNNDVAWWSIYNILRTHVYKINDESLVELKREKDLRFKVYPSPASSEVNVRLDITKSNPGTIVLLNSRGQVLEENESFDVSQTTKIQLQPYPSGTYYVHVTFKGENFVKKIIVE